MAEGGEDTFLLSLLLSFAILVLLLLPWIVYKQRGQGSICGWTVPQVKVLAIDGGEQEDRPQN
jgi:hypothetical protein